VANCSGPSDRSSIVSNRSNVIPRP
jgi:hypothetical protein